MVPTAAVLGAVPGSGTGSGQVARPTRQYTASARSPLWPFLATLVIAVGGFALAVSLAAADDRSIEGTSDVAASEWVLVGVLIAATVAAIAWLYRIGANGGTFGLGLILINVFPIDLAVGNIFLSFGSGGVAIGAMIYAAHYLLLYRPFLVGIWRAGDLPAEWAIIGWLPAVVSSPLLFYGLWNESSALVLVGGILAGISGLVQFVSLLAVTIIQHIGIGADRRAVRAAATAG